MNPQSVPYSPSPQQQGLQPQPAPAPLQAEPLYRTPTPVPSAVPAPIPESEIDPFMDDAVNRVRKIPANTIQYRTDSQPSYGSRFDPQANATRARISDNVAGVQAATRLDVGKSSRATPVGNSLAAIRLEQNAEPETSEVVTASVAQPARLPARALPPLRPLVDSEEIVNPLRPR